MLRPLGVLLGVIFVVVLALVVFAVIASYTFLPGLLGSRVADQVQREMNLPKSPQVRLKSDPPPEMLLGRFSGGRIEMRSAVFGGLRTDRVRVDLSAFDLDLPKSIGSGSLETKGEVPGEIRVEVSGAEVGRIARERANLSDVSLEGGELVVGESVNLLGISLPVEVRGRVSLEDGEVVFEPRRTRVAGATLPPELSRSVLRGADFAFPIKGLPKGVTLDRVEIEGDELVLDGETTNIFGLEN